MLVDHLLRRFLAAAATGAQAATIGQMGNMYGTVFHVFADIGVGDGMAKAYVHDGVI